MLGSLIFLLMHRLQPILSAHRRNQTPLTNLRDLLVESIRGLGWFSGFVLRISWNLSVGPYLGTIKINRNFIKIMRGCVKRCLSQVLTSSCLLAIHKITHKRAMHLPKWIRGCARVVCLRYLGIDLKKPTGWEPRGFDDCENTFQVVNSIIVCCVESYLESHLMTLIH